MIYFFTWCSHDCTTNWSLVPSKFSGFFVFNSDILSLPTLSSNNCVNHTGFGTLGPMSPQRATGSTGSRCQVLCLLSKEWLSSICTSGFQTHRLLMVFVGTPPPSAYFSRLPAVQRIPRYLAGICRLFLEGELAGPTHHTLCVADNCLSDNVPARHLNWHSRAEFRLVGTTESRIAPIYPRLSRSRAR